MAMVPELPHSEISQSLEAVRADVSLRGFNSLTEAVEAVERPVKMMGIALHKAFNRVNLETHPGVSTSKTNLWVAQGKEHRDITFWFTPEEIADAPEAVRQVFQDLQITPADRIEAHLQLQDINLEPTPDEGWRFDIDFRPTGAMISDGRSGFSATSLGHLQLNPTPDEANYRSELERKMHHFFNRQFRPGGSMHPYIAQILVEAGYMVGNAIDARRAKPEAAKELPPG